MDKPKCGNHWGSQMYCCSNLQTAIFDLVCLKRSVTHSGYVTYFSSFSSLLGWEYKPSSLSSSFSLFSHNRRPCGRLYGTTAAGRTLGQGDRSAGS